MKMKHVSLFIVWCCLLIACMLFIMFPIDIKFLYTWLVSNEQNKEKSIAEYENTADTLYAADRTYYRAVLLKFSDTKTSIEITKNLLNDTTLIKSQRISALTLLGELYYIIREYKLASDVYWKVLIMMPENNTVRHNYELMILFDEIQKRILSKNKNARNTIAKEPRDAKSNLDDLPQLLQKVNQNTDYFLYTQDQSLKSELPAW